MKLPPTVELVKPETFKKIELNTEDHPLVTWLPPCLQMMYQKSGTVRQHLNPILNQLANVIFRLTYPVGEGLCPTCKAKGQNRPTRPYYSQKKQIITTGGVQLEIKIVYHRCPVCKGRISDTQTLTWPGEVYDRGIVNLAVASYACGTSYEYTRGILATATGVTPATSTIHKWVIKRGKDAHQLNKDALASVQVEAVSLDEQYTTVRDQHSPAGHTSVFETVIQELKEGAILHVGHSVGKQTNYAIVVSNLKHIIHHNPSLILGDGCSSYPGAIKDVFPQASFVRDLVHQVRNIRKRPRMKKLLKAYGEEFAQDIRHNEELRWSRDRIIFLKAQKHTAATQELGTKEVRWTNQRIADYDKHQAQERVLKEHLWQTMTQTFTTHLHRRLYVGQAAARYVQARQTNPHAPKDPLTTCQLEGTNRTARVRERAALCYRACQTPYVMWGLITLRHNTVEVGKGNIYRRLHATPPSAHLNPFAKFPARKRPSFPAQLTLSTPLRQKETKYRQQLSHQLPSPFEEDQRDYGRNEPMLTAETGPEIVV